MKDLKDRLKNHLADKDREWEWCTNGVGITKRNWRFWLKRIRTNETKKRWMNKERQRITRRKREKKKRKEKMRKIRNTRIRKGRRGRVGRGDARKRKREGKARAFCEKCGACRRVPRSRVLSVIGVTPLIRAILFKDRENVNVNTQLYHLPFYPIHSSRRHVT